MGFTRRSIRGATAICFALAVTLLSSAGHLAAQVSAPSLSNASSANENTGPSPNPSFQRFSDTQTLSTGGSGFQTRYFGNASADCGPACGPKTETLATNYTVSWNVTAPNIYRLQIDTRRTAGLTCGDEGTGNCVSAMNNAACSVSGALATVSGACTLADPADNSSDATTDVNVNQTNTIIVCQQGSGGSQAWSANFTWSNSATTPGTGFISVNSDESAVRLGAPNLDSSNGAANYPGTGGRTQSNDGHFVTLTYTNLCGNGAIDTCGAASEQCDDGLANGTAGSCCTTDCRFKSNGTACTDDGLICTTDTCSGASSVCQHPAGNGGTVCRASGGVCDPQETCTGSSPACPADAKSSSVCRASGGVCDPAESCDGVGNNCPANAKFGTAVTCRGSAGICDIGEVCDGIGDNCPGDSFVSSSTTCRGSAGVCDSAENCTGAAAACPADAKLVTGTTCRGSAGICDVAEVCDGSNDACPGDGFQSSSTTCRASAGECDVQESCTGSSAACPANGFVASGTSCTDTSPPASGNCKDAQCDGSGTCDQNFADETDGSSCDDSLFCNGTDTCSSGSCTTHTGDPCPGPDGDANCAESCDESADDCNGNDVDGSTCDDALFCNGTDSCSSGSCTTHAGDPCPGPDGDVNCAESCDESADDCNANDVDGSTCRLATGPCDVTETCSAGACPSDGFQPSGTVCDAGSGDLCDPDEVCDGATAPCPSDTVAPGGTVCNPGSGDLCDPDETCSGVADQPCPSDTVAPGGTVCNPGSGDLCDPDEVCSGTADQACPSDTVASSSTECRGTAGDCDAAENCTGVADQGCPADGFQPNTVECRSVTTGEVCDEAEFCTGTGPTCPADLVKANTEECRPTAGDCDPAEQCDGVNKTCPADAKEPATTECRGSAGVCDVAENCDGVSDACPADQFEPSTLSCRATSTGELCDQEEFCTGSGATCPADAVKASGTVCRGGIDLCDADEICDGSSKLCPSDAVEPNGTPCRPAVGACDLTENCDGSSTACPANAFQSSGTACGSNANTDCDNPDSCDGGGTCLTNNEPNGTSCDDLSACTSGEACQTGVCTGGTDVCPDLDHYKCYQGKDLKNPKFNKVAVETDDQLATNEFVDVKKLKFICTPVDKNGEGINSPGAHLACYQLKAPKFAVRPKVSVSTQFQTSQFEIKKGKLLCLPATKVLVP